MLPNPPIPPNPLSPPKPLEPIDVPVLLRPVTVWP